jgi:hypothetical protein
MSSLKSAIAILANEPETTAEAIAKSSGPMLVPNTGKRIANRITRRVEAVLDVDFANGSMPA